MSTQWKTMGLLGLLATVALAGFTAIDASAETGGHFTSEATHTIVTGIEETDVNQPEFRVPGLNPIVCDAASYTGTTNATTVEEITITPTYANCHTTGSAAVVTVDVNECQYTLRIGKKVSADNTVDLVCPGAKKYIAVTHEGCEIRIPAKNGIKGIAYSTITVVSKHALTLNLTLSGFEQNFEAGFCVLLGTSHTGELIGSVNVSGKDTTGVPVGITATGSESEPGGHFTSEAIHTIIKGTDETGANQPEFKFPGLGGIVCDATTYEGTTNASTTESITITPSYLNCHTTGQPLGNTAVAVNGCQYTFTIGPKAAQDNTVDLICPGATKYMTIIHEGCEIRIPEKSNLKGAAYSTTEIEGKHALTIELTLSGFEDNYEGGFCILLGTSHTGELIGSVNVQGKDTAGNPVGITATGSEG